MQGKDVINRNLENDLKLLERSEANLREIDNQLSANISPRQRSALLERQYIVNDAYVHALERVRWIAEYQGVSLEDFGLDENEARGKETRTYQAIALSTAEQVRFYSAGLGVDESALENIKANLDYFQEAIIFLGRSSEEYGLTNEAIEELTNKYYQDEAKKLAERIRDGIAQLRDGGLPALNSFNVDHFYHFLEQINKSTYDDNKRRPADYGLTDEILGELRRTLQISDARGRLEVIKKQFMKQPMQVHPVHVYRELRQMYGYLEDAQATLADINSTEEEISSILTILKSFHPQAVQEIESGHLSQPVPKVYFNAPLHTHDEITESWGRNN